MDGRDGLNVQRNLNVGPAPHLGSLLFNPSGVLGHSLAIILAAPSCKKQHIINTITYHSDYPQVKEMGLKIILAVQHTKPE